jgi:hypothetical protein
MGSRHQQHDGGRERYEKPFHNVIFLSAVQVVLHQSVSDDMGHVVPTRAFDGKLPIVIATFQGGSCAVDVEGSHGLGARPASQP